MRCSASIGTSKNRSDVKHTSNIVEQERKRCWRTRYDIIRLFAALRGKLRRNFAKRARDSKLSRKAQVTPNANDNRICLRHEDFLDCHVVALLGRE